MQATVAGMVANSGIDSATADAAEKNSTPADDKLPHTTAAIVAISARAGLAVTAGQSVQLANGETVVLMSGADSQFVSGGQLRAHSRQTVGVQVVAAKDAIDIQAQADVLKMQAHDDVKVVSAKAFVDLAAAKKISLSTAVLRSSHLDFLVRCP